MDISTNIDLNYLKDELLLNNIINDDLDDEIFKFLIKLNKYKNKLKKLNIISKSNIKYDNILSYNIKCFLFKIAYNGKVKLLYDVNISKTLYNPTYFDLLCETTNLIKPILNSDYISLEDFNIKKKKKDILYIVPIIYF